MQVRIKELTEPKFCKKCNKTKTRADFNARKNHGINGIAHMCRDCQLKSNKDYYYKNHERSLAVAAQWRKDNPELFKIQQREWKENNPQRKKELEHRRRTRKQDNGVYAISAKDMRRLGEPCVYCGSNDSITMDHVIPISRGGTHGIGNLVPACHACNIRKNDKTVMEWRMGKPRPRRG